MRMDGRTERHDKAKSRFSQFCERAYKEEVTTDLEMGCYW